MDGEQVLVGENPFGLDLFDFATEEFLVDEPGTAIVEEDFLCDELLVLLEVGDEVFQVLPPEGDAASPAVLLDQVDGPDAEVVVIDAMPMQNDLIHCRHYLNHPLQNILVLGRNQNIGCEVFPLHWFSLRFILLSCLPVKHRYAFGQHDQNLRVESQLGVVLNVLEQNLLAKIGNHRVRRHCALDHK